MKKLALLAALSLSTVLASAQVFNFSMSAANEVPANPSAATGFGTATLTGLTLSWDISYSGLSGNPTAGHFHGPAPAGVNAGVQVGWNVSGLATSGNITGTATLTAQQASDLGSGLWYANLHSALNPGGEIRGQVVPEPSTYALLAMGVGALGYVARRRKAA